MEPTIVEASKPLPAYTHTHTDMHMHACMHAYTHTQVYVKALVKWGITPLLVNIGYQIKSPGRSYFSRTC